MVRIIYDNINFYKALSEYDVTGWLPNSDSADRNVIDGVLKRGEPIVILIRPANGSFIKFHSTFELEMLSKENCELWGSTNRLAKRICFGDVMI